MGFFVFVCENLVENSLKLWEQNLLDAYQLPPKTTRSLEGDACVEARKASRLPSHSAHAANLGLPWGHQGPCSLMTSAAFHLLLQTALQRTASAAGLFLFSPRCLLCSQFWLLGS